ncbi:MAG: hypothetical protein Q7S20_04330 [Gemmatimonadaceae bacterium]|nr:hypothetical protein [Gemmatimonadaceae bacterium]
MKFRLAIRHGIARAGRVAALAIVVAAAAACSEASGPAVAVTLTLYSVDGVVVPAQGRTPGGRLVSIAGGKLQGTNWGFACGFALRLVEGPITAVDVPSCQLMPDEERRFKVTFADSRFPAGEHEYRFVP